MAFVFPFAYSPHSVVPNPMIIIVKTTTKKMQWIYRNFAAGHRKMMRQEQQQQQQKPPRQRRWRRRWQREKMLVGKKTKWEEGNESIDAHNAICRHRSFAFHLYLGSADFQINIFIVCKTKTDQLTDQPKKTQPSFLERKKPPEPWESHSLTLNCLIRQKIGSLDKKKFNTNEGK